MNWRAVSTSIYGWLSQLTPGDWTLLIGLLSNAAAMFYGMMRIGHKVETARSDIKVVAVATDGLQKAILEAAVHEAEIRGRDNEKIDEANRREKIMSDTPTATLSDYDTINQIIQILENVVALVNQYEPMALALPQVSGLVDQVNGLKTGRGL